MHNIEAVATAMVYVLADNGLMILGLHLLFEPWLNRNKQYQSVRRLLGLCALIGAGFIFWFLWVSIESNHK